jgi:hypothetical protein
MPTLKIVVGLDIIRRLEARVRHQNSDLRKGWRMSKVRLLESARLFPDASLGPRCSLASTLTSSPYFQPQTFSIH